MRTIIFKAFFYKITIFLSIVFIITVWVSSIPRNALSPSFKIKRIINVILPQGWSFFTRSPREDLADLYKVEGNRLIKLTLPNAEPKFGFGLSRKSRRIGFELSQIANRINSNHWTNMTGEIKISLIKFDTLNKVKDVENIEPGKYIVQLYKPVPWNYASGSGIYLNQSRVAGIYLR